MPRKFKIYTKEEEEEILRWYNKIPLKGLARRFNTSEQSVARKIRKMGLHRENKTRFKKGRTPWNKGLKGLTNTSETKFKKGYKSPNKKPDGYITIRKEKDKKVRYIKVDGVWTRYSRYIWQQNYGNIPDNYVVRYKDDDYLNDDIENLELISTSDNLNKNRNIEKSIETLKKTLRLKRLKQIYKY